MNRRTTLSTLAATAAALGVPPGARAADLTALQIGTMPTDGSAQPFYGVDRNFFKDAGFSATVTILNNSGTSPVNVIMAAQNSTVKSGADLNGQTVAVNGLRDLTQYEMQAWIDQTGGNVGSVKLIEIPFSEMATALVAGRVAAAILAEPAWTAALATCRVVGNGSAAVGECQSRRHPRDRPEIHQDHGRRRRAHGACRARRNQTGPGADSAGDRPRRQVRRSAAPSRIRTDLARLTTRGRYQTVVSRMSMPPWRSTR